MNTLIARLKEHDESGTAYWLDYVTLKTGFVYRNLEVSRYSEDSILGTYQHPKSGDTTEVYLQVEEIASSQIITK